MSGHSKPKSDAKLRINSLITKCFAKLFLFFFTTENLPYPTWRRHAKSRDEFPPLDMVIFDNLTVFKKV